MKKSLVIIFSLIFCATLLVRAENLTEGFGVGFGYKGIDLNSSASHSTHPADSSFMSGDPGDTKLGFAHYLTLGGRYQQPLTKSLWFNVDLGLMLGLSRDQHQNDNDSRASENSSQVYSKSTWGGYGCLGLNYMCNENWYVGIEGQIAGVSVDSGWNRWNSDQSESSEFLWIPTAGPKIGYLFEKNYSIEATAQIGSGGVGGGLMLNYVF